jgi:arylsulfatase
MKNLLKLLISFVMITLFGWAGAIQAQQILPFPPAPSSSTAGPTMAESIYNKQKQPNHLPKDAPNILIILIDDAGPGTPDTYGGEVHSPNLTRVANAGISYNRFHSTAMCSPTRASILTGRNHTNVGFGQIAELANDWDGFNGEIPKSSATMAKVLTEYGYNTAAFGKWHNTPPGVSTSKGPFDLWPTGVGFEYFYGFLAGEASQYEPSLVRNTTVISTPEHLADGSTFQLTGAMADDAIYWLREQKAFNPDKPFFMYWAPGAVHGPHHVTKEWADKYKGKFDDGWDAYREQAFKKQKELGWIPQDTKLTPRDPSMNSWASIPADEKAFQSRLMEIFAGYGEYADYNAGRVLDELEKQGRLGNTLVFYIWGDNGSSAEGQLGSISELIAQNGIKSTVKQQIDALDQLGGLDVLGSAKTDNMYNAGWAWAGSTPYKGTKLLSYFGGTRQPMAVCWPGTIKPDKTPRTQFSHVVDVVPTIYEILDIPFPQVVDGFTQDKIDGTSFKYTFADAQAPDQKHTQFFDIMGSRGIYHDGWYACTFGPRNPWAQGLFDLKTWDPRNDTWELYDLTKDWSQANDLAKQMPEKTRDMQQLFLIESAQNKNMPIGGGLWTFIHPEDRPASPYREWTFFGNIGNMPEFSAPALGNTNNMVKMDLDMPKDANGVLYALGGFSGGLTLYMKDGYLNYEYNLFEIQRTKMKSPNKIEAGKTEVSVHSTFQWNTNRELVGKVAVMVNGKEVMNTTVPICAPIAFTANDCFDIGHDSHSPVSEAYFAKKPFTFEGTVNTTDIKYDVKK